MPQRYLEEGSFGKKRCRRPVGWKATVHQAICYLHFIGWDNGPTAEHPDPVLSAYNGWGRNCVGVIHRKANSLQRRGQNGTAEQKGPNQASTSTQSNIQTLLTVEEEVPQDIQDWVEVEAVTTTTGSRNF